MVTTSPIRIFPIATDSAGCYYQRLKMPLEALERVFPGEFDVCWTGCEPKDGIVLGQRIPGRGDEPDPQWAIWADREDLALIYEIDDNILDIDPANRIPWQAFAPQRAGTVANMGLSDAVIASTRVLARQVAEEFMATGVRPPIFEAYNCIESWSEIDFDAVDLLHPQAVIWAGSAFHQQDFPDSTVMDLMTARDLHPSLGWVNIGARYLPWASAIGWSDIPTYHRNLRMYAGFGVGIAPLVDTRFNAGKSWIKALDYAAAGVAPLVPAIGAYAHAGELDEPFATTFDPQGTSYADALDLWMCRPRAVRLDTSRATHAAARHWTIDRQVWRWAEAFRAVAAMRGL